MGRFVILGTGRLGTTWTTLALGAMGLRVGHEAVFDWQADSGSERRWDGLDGDASLGCIGWPQRLPEVRPLVVRHPLRVVQSFDDLRFWHDTCECHSPGEHLEAPYAKFITALMPELKECNSPLERTVTYLTLWLERGISMCTSIWTHEDVSTSPEALLSLATECGSTKTLATATRALQHIGPVNAAPHRKVHPQQRRVVTVDDLLDIPLGARLMEMWDECSEQSRSKIA